MREEIREISSGLLHGGEMTSSCTDFLKYPMHIVNTIYGSGGTKGNFIQVLLTTHTQHTMNRSGAA